MRPRRPRLEGKTAVITGIASGRGRAAALLFAAEGAVIVGCDMNDDGAAATVGLVRQAGGEAFSSRVGSTAGVTGSVTNGRLAHTATKGAVVAMTRQLAAEGAPHNIRANTVSPGMIRTEATEKDLLAPDHPMNSIASAIPLGRIGTPEEVAACALFLASDEASYVTGANLMIDGGWSAVLPG